MWKFINTYVGIPISVIGILVGIISLPEDLHSIFSLLPKSITSDWVRLCIGMISFFYFVFLTISWIGRENWKPNFFRSYIYLSDAAKYAYQELYWTSAGLIPEITFSQDPLLYYLLALTVDNEEIYGVRFSTGVEELISKEELVRGMFIDNGNKYQELNTSNPSWTHLKIKTFYLKQYIKEQKKRNVIKDVRKFIRIFNDHRLDSKNVHDRS